ncbi:unnamed protein product [Sphenostylis stenocarpa]|uniref:Uncharacterized protein n=1 Tax=Sphenostylis stenocarpa TaxID=92480 RepID=A0AA86VD13_9FABA|nr:unnamed protein product [Sphenostylis stenocarpa]
MDSTAQVTKTPSFWTDEKHMHFLNTMEASFVRAMLENQGTSNPSPTHHSLRLDRYLPDTFDSTLDLKPHPHRIRKLHAPADSIGPRSRPRKRSSQPCNSSQDQVGVCANNRGTQCSPMKQGDISPYICEQKWRQEQQKSLSFATKFSSRSWKSTGASFNSRVESTQQRALQLALVKKEEFWYIMESKDSNVGDEITRISKR